MYWYIIKLIGEPIAKKALDDFTGPRVAKLKAMLFGPQKDEVNEYLKKLDRQMQEVARSLDNIELRQIFLEYNRADEELRYLLELYDAQKKRPLNDRDRQNTCAYILDINKGVSERARRMINAFRHINLPSYKSMLQEYSDKLLDKYPDVFSYCDKVGAVMDHLTVNLFEAKALREGCYEDIIDKEKVTDLALTQADIGIVEEHYAEVAGNAEEIIGQFEQFAEKGNYVRLKHQPSGKYLTAYEEGKPYSPDKPFGYYVEPQISDKTPKSLRSGMPQLFLYELGKGQEVSYSVNRSSSVSERRVVPFKIDGSSQEWQLIKLEGDDQPVRFALQLREKEKALDGTTEGRVYLNPPRKDEGNQWWRPVPLRNKEGRIESGLFMLQHVRSESALDSDNTRVYAEGRRPDYDNTYMRWSLFQKHTNTLEVQEFLAPGEELVSRNLLYALRYQKDGNLELIDRREQKTLWGSGTKGKAAWRCVMLGDGNFVVFDQSPKVVWETGSSRSGSDGCKLVLNDDGSLQVIKRNGEAIYTRSKDAKSLSDRRKTRKSRPR